MSVGKTVGPAVLLGLILWASSAHAGPPSYLVDEIVEAVKAEVWGAQATEAEYPRIEIDRFDLDLSVVAMRTAEGLRLEVPGVEGRGRDGFPRGTAHHVRITLQPSSEMPVTPGASNLGLLPAIQSIKASLQDAYTAPPHFTPQILDFEIEFVVAQTERERLRFVVLETGNNAYRRFITHHLIIHMSLYDPGVQEK